MRERGVSLVGLLVALGLVAASSASAGVFVVRNADGSAKIVNVPGIESRGNIPQGSSSGRSTLWPTVEEFSRKRGLDPHLVDLVIRMESGYNSRAVSPKGAIGVMQLMPETAKSYGVDNPFNAYENIRAGVSYLADLVEHFDSDLALALAAYNAGPQAVQRHGGIPPYSETRRYVSSILAAYEGRTGPVLSGGFGRAVPRRPVEVDRVSSGTLVTNTPRVGEPAVGKLLSLR